MKIVLLGYMASGKSIVAKELAKQLDVLYIDLDSYIEQKENLLISEIFKIKGEIKFRLLENKYLTLILKSKKQFVLSVGGGTPCYANNLNLIKKYSKNIYLKASINTLFKRIVIEKEKRPLVAKIDDDNLKEFIAKHLFERNLFYNQANYTVLVNDKSVAKIIADLLQLI